MRKLLPILLVGLLASCSSNNPVIEGEVFCFDTVIESKLYEGEKSYLNDIKDIIEYYDKVSDSYHDRGGITIRNIPSTPVKVDPKLYNLLKTSVDVASEGATYFNPFCGSLAKAWKNSLEKKEVLSEEIIKEKLQEMKATSLVFDEDNTLYKIGNGEIDLGGIVKGYAIDEIKTYLESKNMTKYLINAGFSSILLGKKNTEDGLFKIKISDVDNTFVKLKDCVVSTSSKAVQGVRIKDITYSHIINPITGSAINNNDAVIVVSSKGYLGDALSTSMMMNTVEEIKEIEASQNVKCIVIKNRQVIYSNEGLTLIHE